MSSGNGAVDVILWIAALALLIAFSSAVYQRDYIAFGVYGAGLLVCLGVQQYLKKANGRTRSDDG